MNGISRHAHLAKTWSCSVICPPASERSRYHGSLDFAAGSGSGRSFGPSQCVPPFTKRREMPTLCPKQNAGGHAMWTQIYDPLGNAVLSTLVAAAPTILLLALIASGKMRIHLAAVTAVMVADLIAIMIYGMPAGLALRAAGLGALAGLFPLRLIILHVVLLHPSQGGQGPLAILPAPGG